MALNGPTITLPDLEAFDPHASGAGPYRRFCCPLCGGAKPRDAGHRSLSVQVVTGYWRCFRCQAHGRLPGSRQAGSHGRHVFALSKSTPPPSGRVSAPTPLLWQQVYEQATEVLDGPGAEYLAHRRIPAAIAQAAGVRFTADWYGRTAILFPLHNRKDDLVAVCGRHTDDGQPKVHNGGEATHGVFDPFKAVKAQRTVLVEAPLCALTLALYGVPALALCGTVAPRWLPSLLAFHAVALALDADEAGDQGSRILSIPLQSFGCRIQRWRPSGAKDWNELLMQRDGGALPTAIGNFGYVPGGHLVAAVLAAGGRFLKTKTADSVLGKLS